LGQRTTPQTTNAVPDLFLARRFLSPGEISDFALVNASG